MTFIAVMNVTLMVATLLLVVWTEFSIARTRRILREEDERRRAREVSRVRCERSTPIGDATGR